MGVQVPGHLNVMESLGDCFCIHLLALGRPVSSRHAHSVTSVSWYSQHISLAEWVFVLNHFPPGDTHWQSHPMSISQQIFMEQFLYRSIGSRHQEPGELETMFNWFLFPAFWELGVCASPGAFWAQSSDGNLWGAASAGRWRERGRPGVRALGRGGPQAHKGGGGKAGRGGPGAGAAGRGGGRAGRDKAPAATAGQLAL